jgi:excisionase family DNA binding protein
MSCNNRTEYSRPLPFAKQASWHKIHQNGGSMTKERDEVLTTEEACRYLKISRPTFLKLVYSDQIRARKVGRGWKVRRAQIEAYLARGGEAF